MPADCVTAVAARACGGPMDWLLRAIFKNLIRNGNLRVTTARGSTMTLGDGTGPEAAIRFTSPATERRILIDPELRFGEAYMDGAIVVERARSQTCSRSCSRKPTRVGPPAGRDCSG